MKYLILIPIFVTMCVAQVKVAPSPNKEYIILNPELPTFGTPCNINASGVLYWVAPIGDSVLVRYEYSQDSMVIMGWSSNDRQPHYCPENSLFLIPRKLWDERVVADTKQHELDSLARIAKQKSDEILKEKIRKILEKTK